MYIYRIILDGLILSFLMAVTIISILRLNPRYEMKSYPKEILNEVEPQTEEEKQGFLRIALPMMILIFIFLVDRVRSAYLNSYVTYVLLFLHTFFILMIWNTIDLLFMDWLLFCTITPNFIILPGTKGNKGYKNYKYHFIGFLKGIVISAFCSLAIAAIVMII